MRLIWNLGSLACIVWAVGAQDISAGEKTSIRKHPSWLVPKKRKQGAADRQTPPGDVRLPPLLGTKASSERSLAVDPEIYRLRPGDVLRVGIVALAEYWQEAVVSADGMVVLEKLGGIEVGGLTLNAAKKAVAEAAEAFFRSPKVTVALMHIQSVAVEVAGQVENPGRYVVPPLTSVMELINLAGGLRFAGSRREIVHLRRGQEVAAFDLYRILLSGEVPGAMLLESDDILLVPYAERQVEVRGAVAEPGIYELRREENVGALVSWAGGFVPDAAPDMATLQRWTTGNQADLVPLDLSRSEGRKTPLQAGDVIDVPSHTELGPKVRITGELNGSETVVLTAGGSGLYSLRAGERVRDVILNAGGITARADGTKTFVRRRSESGAETQISFLLTKAMAQDTDHNLALLPGDELVIPSLPDSVYVFGAVNRPGPVAFKENRPVAHYIAEAGGPSGRARATRVGIFTTDLSRKAVEVKSTDPRIVQAGEVVYVPERAVKGFADYAQIIFVTRAILAGINP